MKEHGMEWIYIYVHRQWTWENVVHRKRGLEVELIGDARAAKKKEEEDLCCVLAPVCLHFEQDTECLELSQYTES